MRSLASYEHPMVCLVRHGETEFSAARRYNGRTDTALTKNGEGQAERLRSRLSDVTWDAVYSSPLGRARRTAVLAGCQDSQIVKELIKAIGEFLGDFRKTVQE